MDPDYIPDQARSDIEGAEVPMAQLALHDEKRI